jgi:serine carboxypeptidase-like clade 2
LQIGNPLLEFNTDFNSVDEYYWSHGLISDGVYELLTKVCNGSEILRGNIGGFLSPACIFVAIQLQKELSNTVNMYNVIGNDHCLDNQSQMVALYEPLSSRIQASLSPHSQQNALGDKQVKFTLCKRVRRKR